MDSNWFSPGQRTVLCIMLQWKQCETNLSLSYANVCIVNLFLFLWPVSNKMYSFFCSISSSYLESIWFDVDAIQKWLRPLYGKHPIRKKPATYSFPFIEPLSTFAYQIPFFFSLFLAALLLGLSYFIPFSYATSHNAQLKE